MIDSIINFFTGLLLGYRDVETPLQLAGWVLGVAGVASLIYIFLHKVGFFKACWKKVIIASLTYTFLAVAVGGIAGSKETFAYAAFYLTWAWLAGFPLGLYLRKDIIEAEDQD